MNLEAGITANLADKKNSEGQLPDDVERVASQQPEAPVRESREWTPNEVSAVRSMTREYEQGVQAKMKEMGPDKTRRFGKVRKVIAGVVSAFIMAGASAAFAETDKQSQEIELPPGMAEQIKDADKPMGWDKVDWSQEPVTSVEGSRRANKRSENDFLTNYESLRIGQHKPVVSDKPSTKIFVSPDGVGFKVDLPISIGKNPNEVPTDLKWGIRQIREQFSSAISLDIQTLCNMIVYGDPKRQIEDHDATLGNDRRTLENAGELSTVDDVR